MKHELKKLDYLHPNDAVATKMYVLRECMKGSEENRVIMYKTPGDDFTVGDHSELSHHEDYENIFCLGIQTKEQALILNKFGGKILCADATHELTQYEGYQLVSVVVKTDQGKGYPVSHLITSNVDAVILTAYFKELQKRNPTLKVQYAMSDDDQALKKAFKAAFGDDVLCLFCYWHLREAWKRNLVTRVNDADVRQAIYNVLQETLIVTTEKEFNEIITSMRTLFSDWTDFMGYFERNYLPHAKEWARCFRNFDHDKVDTNMLLESLHNLIKSVFLDRKLTRRIEMLLVTLCEIDVEFFRLYKLFVKIYYNNKGNLNVSARHKRGMSIENSHVTQVSFQYRVASDF